MIFNEEIERRLAKVAKAEEKKKKHIRIFCAMVSWGLEFLAFIFLPCYLIWLSSKSGYKKIELSILWFLILFIKYAVRPLLLYRIDKDIKKAKIANALFKN